MPNDEEIAGEVEEVPTELKQEASETTALAEGGADVPAEPEPAAQGTRPQRQLPWRYYQLFICHTNTEQTPALLQKPQSPSKPTL